MAGGVLLLLLGIWLIARTVTTDPSGQNLAKRILSL